MPGAGNARLRVEAITGASGIFYSRRSAEATAKWAGSHDVHATLSAAQKLAIQPLLKSARRAANLFIFHHDDVTASGTRAATRVPGERITPNDAVETR